MSDLSVIGSGPNEYLRRKHLDTLSRLDGGIDHNYN